VLGVSAASRRPRQQAPREQAGRSELLTLAAVLAELGVPKSTFFRWKATGRAPRTIRLPNGRLRVRRGDLDEWVAAHEEEAPAV
jgi:predicted DNA-binding transcriptional regulator AlpA